MTTVLRMDQTISLAEIWLSATLFQLHHLTEGNEDWKCDAESRSLLRKMQIMQNCSMVRYQKRRPLECHDEQMSLSELV